MYKAPPDVRIGIMIYTSHIHGDIWHLYCPHRYCTPAP